MVLIATTEGGRSVSNPRRLTLGLMVPLTPRRRSSDTRASSSAAVPHSMIQSPTSANRPAPATSSRRRPAAALWLRRTSAPPAGTTAPVLRRGPARSPALGPARSPALGPARSPALGPARSPALGPALSAFFDPLRGPLSNLFRQHRAYLLQPRQRLGLPAPETPRQQHLRHPRPERLRQLLVTLRVHDIIVR